MPSARASSATEPDPLRYRAVIGHFATAVAVITSSGPRGPVGMTANALSSLSLDPVLLLVAFDNASRTLPVVRESGRFGVNVLSADQQPLAHVFASKAPEAEKFAGVPHRMEDGVPVLDGAVAWLACDLRELVPGGDHTVGIGAVTSMGDRAGEPLMWYRGGYTTLSHRPVEASEDL